MLNLDGGALFNASALPPSSPRSLRGIANNHMPARAQREQDADAQIHKTPAQVKDSPAVARRLDGTCEGLVNPNLNGPCVDGYPHGWEKYSNRAPGDCVDAGGDEYVDLSNSRPAEAVLQVVPAGYVWGAGTMVEITFRVDYASLRGDGAVASSPEAPVEFLTWFRNPDNGEKFFRQFNFNYRHDSNSNGRKI